MACIDIFAPGRLLTVQLLVEQIWLRSVGKKLLPVEVYDVLIQVDDGKPLDSLLIGSPHFCRRQLRDGSFKDSVYLLPIGDWRTHWGWFYYGDEVHDSDSGRLTLRLPNCIEPTGPAVLPFEGYILSQAKISWCDSLAEPSATKLMAEIKKSFYQISFPQQPLQPGDGNQAWFRLLVEPVELECDPPLSGIAQSFIDPILPCWNLAANISCPVHVRAVTRDRIAHLRVSHPEMKPLIDNLEQDVVTKGFMAEGTSTRIIEHRLMLSGIGVKIEVQGGPVPTIAYIGAQSVRLKIPPFEHDYNEEPCPQKLQEIRAVVHNWSAGSVRNSQHDLIGVICAFIDEANFGAPKPMQHIVGAITSSAFREGCFLIKKMVTVGLMKFDGSGNCIHPKMSDTDFTKRCCEMRRLYLKPEEFTAFPEAQCAFLDLHSFRIDFTASWVSKPIWRMVLLCGMAALSILAFVLSILALLKG